MIPSSCRLCIFCRRLESNNSPCPSLQNAPTNSTSVPIASRTALTPISSDDEQLLEALQRQPSQLCPRCASYNVLDVFEHSDPPTRTDHLSSSEYIEYCEAQGKYDMALGELSSLVLSPSCPLCRLIYRIFPRERLDPEESMKLVPFRSYVRNTGWEQMPADVASQCAIFLGLRTPAFQLAAGVTSGLGLGDQNIRHGIMLGEVICLSSQSAFPGRTMCNGQLVGPRIDFSKVGKILKFCEDNHGEGCRRNNAPELRTTMMLDVNLRKVVPCPTNCDYVALSYVWGGVMPAPDALQSRTLPQTIEDAITATKDLGRRYLWVDALCINQSPNPTPDELAVKMGQLKIMDLIYAGAAVTIVALAGNNSNAGLVGVSSVLPRAKQMQQVINGRTLFTIPPEHVAEIEASIWDSRAWTLQEGILSKRYLHFTQNQLHFVCQRGKLSESVDSGSIPPGIDDHPATSLLTAITGPVMNASTQASTLQLDVFSNTIPYASLLSGYTSRRMTNDGDSLNALLGVLSAFERRLFSAGFMCGLPLASHPESLAWMHDRQVTPKRRPLFPSWSWAGWEGTVIFPDMVFDQRSRRGQWGCRSDMKPRVLTHSNDNKLVVEGWLVSLQVVTQPFSAAQIPATDELMGSIVERNFLHANTIPSGKYDCLIIQRVTYKPVQDGAEKQLVFIMMLEWDGSEARRKTMASFWTFQGEDFMRLLPERKTITLI